MGSIKEEFVKFITKGNLVQLAVAFVLGLAFSALITALVGDIFTPLIGVAGKFDFSTWNYTVNGSTFQQGAFLNQVISFALVAVVLFFVIALPYQRFADRQAAKKPVPTPTTRECPECLSMIPIPAKRCMYCPSLVPPAAPAAPLKA